MRKESEAFAQERQDFVEILMSLNHRVGQLEPTFARYGLERGPLRLRGYSQEFRPTEAATPILQLRALFGINVRCETHYCRHRKFVSSC